MTTPAQFELTPKQVADLMALAHGRCSPELAVLLECRRSWRQVSSTNVMSDDQFLVYVIEKLTECLEDVKRLNTELAIRIPVQITLPRDRVVCVPGADKKLSERLQEFLNRGVPDGPGYIGGLYSRRNLEALVEDLKQGEE